MELNESIEKLRQNSDPIIRRKAAETLFESKNWNYEIVDVLVFGLQDKDSGVKDVCARALESVPKEFGYETSLILAPYICHNNIEIRNLASDILIKLGPLSAEPISEFLTNQSSDIKKFSCDLLGAIGNPIVIPKIKALLNDKDLNVIVAAIEALGNLKNKDSLALIISFYDKDIDLKPTVIDAVGKIGGKLAEEFLLTKLEFETDNFLKTACIDSLARCGEDIHICQLLINQLSNAIPDIQIILLKTIYAIAFRNELEIEFPNEYRYIAHKALIEQDEDFRMAGLLALGNEYQKNDIEFLVTEVLKDNSDTQLLIMENLLLNSNSIIITIFFRELWTNLKTDSMVIVLLSYLSNYWHKAKKQNINAIIDELITLIYETSVVYSKELIELLLTIDRNYTIELIKNQMQTATINILLETIEIIYSLSLEELYENIEEISKKSEILINGIANFKKEKENKELI